MAAVRNLLKRLDASELPQPDCVLLGQLADEFERHRKAAIVFSGQGHRLWCPLKNDSHLPRGACNCGLKELQDALHTEGGGDE